MRYRPVRVASYRLTYLCAITWIAVFDGRNYNWGAIYFGFIHRYIGILHPPPQVLSEGEMPFVKYMRPGMGLGVLHIPLQMLAI